MRIRFLVLGLALAVLPTLPCVRADDPPVSGSDADDDTPLGAGPKEIAAEKAAKEGHWQEAAALFDEAVLEYGNAGRALCAARVRLRAGQCRVSAGRWMEGFSNLFDVLRDAHDTGVVTIADDAWPDLARAATAIGRDKDVAGEFHLIEQALQRVPESDRSLRARIFLHRIGRYRDLGWDDKLVPALDAFIEFNRGTDPPDAAGEARALTLRGRERCRMRKVDEGLADFAAAEAAQRKIADIESLADTLTAAGFARLTQKGDAARAVPLLREAVELFGRHRNRAGQVRAMEGWEQGLMDQKQVAEAARLRAMRDEVQARGAVQGPPDIEWHLPTPQDAPAGGIRFAPGDPWIELSRSGGTLTGRMCCAGAAPLSTPLTEYPQTVCANGTNLACTGGWVRAGARAVFLADGDRAVLTAGGDLRRTAPAAPRSRDH